MSRWVAVSSVTMLEFGRQVVVSMLIDDRGRLWERVAGDAPVLLGPPPKDSSARSRSKPKPRP